MSRGRSHELTFRWWCLFWEAFSGGKAGQGPTNTAAYQEVTDRLKTIRQQQLNMSGVFMSPQLSQHGQFQNNGQTPAQSMQSQQAMNFRQQQLRAQAAQATQNGLSQAQQMMQQHTQAQQQQQATHNAMIQQQQRFAQANAQAAASPGGRPPGTPGHPLYQQGAQVGAGSASHPSPSPHLGHQPHPGQPGVMQSPHANAMRPPSINGHAAGQAINPLMRSSTPQQGAQQQQQQQPFVHPGQTPNPAQSPAPLSQAQQIIQAQAAQTHALQQRAQQTLLQHQYAQPHGQGMTREQLGALQMQQQQQHHQQMQAHAAQMYSSLGIGQVDYRLMSYSAQQLGMGNRDAGSMSEDERVSQPDALWTSLMKATVNFEIPNQHGRSSKIRRSRHQRL